MATTYTVVKGDTLSEIAQRYNTTYQKLAELNGINNPDYIVVGQVLRLTADAPTTTTKTSTLKATIKVFGLQSNTDRTVFATWAWNNGNRDHFEVKWYYATGDGVWFIGDSSDTTEMQSLYTAPSNAYKVKFRVKPVAKKRKVNGKETAYWTASWSTDQIYNFKDNPPSTPAVPAVKIEKYKLTASLENVTSGVDSIQFQIVKNDKTTFKTGTAAVTKSSASYLCTVDAGANYKVRCRACKDGEYSAWTNYTTNYSTIPSSPKAIHTIKATQEGYIYLAWNGSATAKTYDLEYATDKRFFDSSDKSQTVNGIKTTQYTLTNHEQGQEYFFRVRSVNDDGESGWSEIVSIITGKNPAAPTTWSSTTSASVGGPLTLYWIHNSEDGSSQTFADLQLKANNVTTEIQVMNSTEEDEKDKTSSYEIDTRVYNDGTKLQWCVRTAGITGVPGEWSTTRTVDIYEPVALSLRLTDNAGADLETVTSLPIYVKGDTGNTAQIPIGYNLSITSNEVYETSDDAGNVKMVNIGEEVYANHFDTNEQLLVELSAYNVNLENNISYTLSCTVAMNSGLTADSSLDFTVSWEDIEYEPNCQIAIDSESLVAHIAPYCVDSDNNPVSDVLLSVYRREYDGSFMEIESDIDGTQNTFITDPHPALDYARYRIVAKSKSTGTVSYYDPPGYPVNEKAVIIQWDEEWSDFDATNEDEQERPAWSGSLLRLPYNIDVSDSNTVDVEHVEYIGRKHPVSYHGTQLGIVSTWNVEIAKSDIDTLYALRRLAIWMGNVYVREPSGSGYWATIKVSFTQTHKSTTIPVTLNITRVEGGV